MVNKKNLKHLILYTLPILLTIRIASAGSAVTTDTDFVVNLNILINNLVQIFVKTSAVLALLSGLIAFIVNLVKLNTSKNHHIKEGAMQNLLEVCVATGIISIAGLIFSAIYFIVLAG